MDQQAIKTALLAACEKYINERIGTIRQRLLSIEEARNNETKSSAGDKFETSRAMMQMEEDKSHTQLADALRVKNELAQIKLDLPGAAIGRGHLVQTTNGSYFLAIGIGKVSLAGQTYYCISPESPIGARLQGQRVGDTITFQDRQMLIQALF